VVEAYYFQGNTLNKTQGKKLHTLKLRDKNSTLELKVRWPGYDFDFRVIAFWYKKKKRIGYFVTNLAIETVPASDVVELYRLRWQIELLFKELKSYCNLKKFSKSNKDIVSTLIYASFIAVLLKRLMAYSTEALKSVWISTSWLSLLVVHVSQGLPVMAALTESIDTIAKLCERAHPKRDLKDGLYQFGVISLVNIGAHG
jgi:hypothetical protein